MPHAGPKVVGEARQPMLLSVLAACLALSAAGQLATLGPPHASHAQIAPLALLKLEEDLEDRLSAIRLRSAYANLDAGAAGFSRMAALGEPLHAPPPPALAQLARDLDGLRTKRRRLLAADAAARAPLAAFLSQEPPAPAPPAVAAAPAPPAADPSTAVATACGSVFLLALVACCSFRTMLSWAVRYELEAFHYSELEKMLTNPELLESTARNIFRSCDADGDGALSIADLEQLIPKLHLQLGLPSGSGGEERHKLLLARMKRFDTTGDGMLEEGEFVQLYRWTLWRQHEDMNPPMFARKKIVGDLQVGVPTQQYNIGNKLGQGTFGVTHLATHISTKVLRVMKTVNKQKAMENGSPMALLQLEVDILASLDHPHIVRLYEYYQDSANIYLIMGLCKGGELLDVVTERAQQRKPIPEALIARIFDQVLEAIAYCHAKGVMHKDLKFENIMLRTKLTDATAVENVHAVIIDMGLAELFGKQHGKGLRSTDIAGTLSTMAPEVLVGDFSYKCDVWSLGCIMFALFNAKPPLVQDHSGHEVVFMYPFPPQRTVKDMVHVQEAGPHMELISDYCGPEVLAIIGDMLTFDEAHRPSAADCLTKQWFQDTHSKRAVDFSKDQVSCITRHREQRHLWQATLGVAAAYLPASKLVHLNELFRAGDNDHNGMIDRDELCRMLASQGVPFDVAQTAADQADMDNSGSIEWSEFVAALLPASHELFASALLTAFSHFDKNHDGCIGKPELMDLLTSGEIDSAHMPANKTAEMILSDLDTDLNGNVSFVEFHNYFLHLDGEATTVMSANDRKIGGEAGL